MGHQHCTGMGALRHRECPKSAPYQASVLGRYSGKATSRFLFNSPLVGENKEPWGGSCLCPPSLEGDGTLCERWEAVTCIHGSTGSSWELITVTCIREHGHPFSSQSPAIPSAPLLLKWWSTPRGGQHAEGISPLHSTPKVEYSVLCSVPPAP